MMEICLLLVTIFSKISLIALNKSVTGLNNFNSLYSFEEPVELKNNNMTLIKMAQRGRAGGGGGGGVLFYISYCNVPLYNQRYCGLLWSEIGCDF